MSHCSELVHLSVLMHLYVSILSIILLRINISCSQPLPLVPSCEAEVKAGFCSIVLVIWRRSAAQRLLIEGAGVDVDSGASVLSLLSTSIPLVDVVVVASEAGNAVKAAMLAPKRAISPLTRRSFLFSAPGRVRRLLCLIFPSAGRDSSDSFSSGRASARDSRVATSFLLGRRRFRVLEEAVADFWTLERRMLCFIMRFSCLVVEKPSETTASGRCVFRGACEGISPLIRAMRFSRAEGGFVGACN